MTRIKSVYKANQFFTGQALAESGSQFSTITLKETHDLVDVFAGIGQVGTI